MAQTKAVSTRHLPVAFKVLPILGLLFLGACFAVQAFLPPEKKDLVSWREPKEALDLAKKSGKPILYDFTAEWCGPCHALTDQVFNDKETSKLINQSFIPVRVLDRQREEGANPIEVESLQKKYHLEGFPTIVITKPDVIDVKKQVGYAGKDGTKKFIRESLIWSYSGDNPYAVKWHTLDDALTLSRQSKKPLLILCWNEKGDYARYEYLADKELMQLLKTNFVTTEFTAPTDQKSLKTDEAKQLITSLEIKRTPAMIIVPVDGSMPHFQIGESNKADNKDFLEKYLRFTTGKKAIR
jgi:thiol-disulfide isomerase/thioredoxin